MPFYHWQGVRLDAAYCKGTLFARDQETLKNVLFVQEIALLSCSAKRYVHIFPISSEQKYLFFQQLQSLLEAGIHVWQALLIICEQTGEPRFAEIALRLADKVQQGNALHEALATFPIFSSEMVHVTEIGAETDNLSVALHMLCSHLASMEAFKKQLRGVLLLPLCTFGIFMCIMLVVLLIVIPKYAKLFASMSKELPSMTRMLMRASNFVGSYYMIGTLFIVITCIIVLSQALKNHHVKERLDKRLLSLPYIGSLVRHITIVNTMRSLALLLQGGMPLVPALCIAKEAVSNSYIKNMLQSIIDQVREGQDLSRAMQSQPELFPQDIVILVTVGQETGHLQGMIARVASMYTQKVQRILQRFTFTVQPMLMIILGLLVAALICAVYLPLFNLADLG